jgi:hypothetical protein
VKEKKRSKIVIWIIVGGLLLALIAGGLAFWLGKRVLDEKRVQSQPPTVMIESPVDGEMAPEGSFIQVSGFASGSSPIAQMELWFDGELQQKQAAEAAQLTTFPASFTVRMTEGTHMVVLRAVDERGLVGNSLPVAVIGTEPVGGAETELVEASEGQTLLDIANELGGDADVLAKLNPGLEMDPLPAGMGVAVPKPPTHAPGQATTETSVPGRTANVSQPGPLPETGSLVKAASPMDFDALLSIFASHMPASPTQLAAGFDKCLVQLQWWDGSANEQSFRVWMQRLGGPPQLIETLEGSPRTGLARFTFPAPVLGIYSFWVEAVNLLGAQPSEIKWMAVNDAACGEGIATMLEIEGLYMLTSAGTDSAYCYVSLEGASEKRIPENAPATIQLKTGPTGTGSDINQHWGGERKVIVPMPIDEELTLEGKCLGLNGITPFILGTFKEQIPRGKWDGTTMEINEGLMVIGYRIQPHGRSDAGGLYELTDYSLPAPRILGVKIQSDKDPQTQARLARAATLEWEWDGDPQDLTGFVVAMDGKELAQVGDKYRSYTLTLPSSCSGKYRFAVAATMRDARSIYSAEYEYVQPDCEMYASVSLDTFTLTSHADGEPSSCDTAELYYMFDLKSGNSGTGFWIWPYGNEEYEIEANCNQTYSFSSSMMRREASEYGSGDLFYVPVDPTTSTIRIDFIFMDCDPWWPIDHCVGGIDYICGYSRWITVPYEEWPAYTKEIKETCKEPHQGEQDGTVDLVYRVQGFRAFAMP